MSGCREEDLLFKNVQDLRKRLQQTQQNLQSLHALENGVREDVVSDVASTTSASECMPPLLNLDDLSPSSAGSQRSYRKERSRKDGARSSRDPGARSSRDPAVRGMAGRSHQSSSSNNNPSYNTEPSFPGPSYASTPTKKTQPSQAVTLGGQSVTQVENETLRRKLHLVREENAKLVSQNHKLLTQLETATYQLHHHNAKIAYLTQESQDYQERLPELEERLVTLEAENEAQESTLREAEVRFEDGQRQLDEFDNQLKHCREQLKGAREELGQERKVRKRAEHERDVALQNVEELQDSLDEIQMKAKDKIKKHQTSEEHLKESLRHADHEREELLDKNSNLQVQIDDLQEELRQHQEESVSAKEMRSEYEHQNLDLRSQLARLTQKIARLDGELQDAALIRQENSALRRLVDQQRGQLEQAQREVGESHAHLVRLEEVASRLTMRSGQSASNSHSVAGSDSGVSTFKAPGSSQDGHQGDDEADSEADLNGSYLETLTVQDGAHGSSAPGSLVADLRQQIAHKEAELQQLRSEMETRAEQSSHAVVVEGLRMELQAALDRNSIAEKRAIELERMISHLEEERTKHVTHIIHLEEKTADMEMMTSSMESRLSQRNTQVVELQKEITEKSNHVTTLEREVRKKTSQIQSLERQLDDKVNEVSEQVTKVTEQEEQLAQHKSQSEKLKAEVEERRKELATCKGTGDRLRDVHREQMEEMEKQIELLEHKWEDGQSQLKAYKKDATSLRLEVAAKDSYIEDIKKELQQHSDQHEGAIGTLQRQVSDSTERCRQLEGALLVCKEEVRVYLEQLEDSKDQNDMALASRDDQIQRLQLEVANVRQSADEKDGQVSELLTALEERQNMLQTSNSRIGELEDLQTQLEAQMSKLEQELHREQSTWQTEVTGMEKKLQQACTELEHRTTQTAEMTNTIKELAREKKHLTEEVNDLERRLHQERRDADTASDQSQKLESEIRELRAHLNEKIEQVEEQDDQMQRLQDELTEREKRLTSLDRELTKAEGDVEYLSAQVDEAHHQLEDTRAELEQRDEMVSGLKHNIRRNQDELRGRSREVEELEDALKERQWELQQRAAQVTQLDMTIKEHKADMEQHIIRLEGALKKTQIELQQKNKQISELDHHVENLQEEIRDKMGQLQQTDMAGRQQRTELDTKTAKLQELQQLYDASRTSLESAKEEGLELTQQLRLARESHQKLHLELTEIKRDAALTQRELDRVTHELDQATTHVQTKEDEVVDLSDKLGKAKVNEAQLETRTNSEIRKLTREMELVKEQHRQEISELRESHTQVLSQKEQEIGSLRSAGREAAHHQEVLIEEIERARSEVAGLEGDLFACKDVIQAANETIVLKEAHIARLEAKLHGFERANLRNSDRNHGNQAAPINHHHRSSSETSMVLPRVSLQRSLKMVNHQQQQGQMPRSASDLTLTYPVSPRVAGMLNNSDPEASQRSNDSPRSNHSVASADDVMNLSSSFGSLRVGSRSNGTDPAPDADSFENMLMQVNQMYYNLNNQSNTASAVTPASSANLKAIRSRLFSDGRIRSTSSTKSSQDSVSRSASNLTGASSSLLRPKTSQAPNSRPVSDSYAMNHQLGSNLLGVNPPFGDPFEPLSVDTHVGRSEGMLTLDMLSAHQKQGGNLYEQASVENLLVPNSGVDGAHGAQNQQEGKGGVKKEQSQQEKQGPTQMVAHANRPPENGGGSVKVTQMIERLSHRANQVASQMEAQAANFNQHSSNHKPNLYDDDDDDDGDNEDSSSDEMDFREREPETAVQQDMITLDLSQ